MAELIQFELGGLELNLELRVVNQQLKLLHLNHLLLLVCYVGRRSEEDSQIKKHLKLLLV